MMGLKRNEPLPTQRIQLNPSKVPTKIWLSVFTGITAASRGFALGVSITRERAASIAHRIDFGTRAIARDKTGGL